MKRTFLFLVVAVSMLGSLAHATPVTTATQTLTFGPQLTEFDRTPRPLQLFDSSLGTLQSVTINVSYAYSSNLNITNNAATPSGGSAFTQSAAVFRSDNAQLDTVLQSLIDKAGKAIIGSATLNPSAFKVLGDTVSYSLAPGESTVQPSDAPPMSIAVTDTNASDLLAFEAPGGGQANVLLSTATATTLSNTGGNTSAFQQTTATGTFQLYYIYGSAPVQSPIPTPEPTTIALLGMGILATKIFRTSRR